jgi:hypothetical protein
MRRAVFNITNAVIRQIVVGWFGFVLIADAASAANYSLSYSGRLTQQNGAAVEGPVDIQVSFWTSNTGGTQRGETLTYLSIELNQGVFALNLDLRPDQVKAIFGDGTEAVFVEIAAAGKVYPRQQYLFVRIIRLLRLTMTANWDLPELQHPLRIVIYPPMVAASLSGWRLRQERCPLRQRII